MSVKDHRYRSSFSRNGWIRVAEGGSPLWWHLADRNNAAVCHDTCSSSEGLYKIDLLDLGNHCNLPASKSCREDNSVRDPCRSGFNCRKDLQQALLHASTTATGEDSRRDSLEHLLDSFFSKTPNAFSHSTKLIRKTEVPAPCNIPLKLDRDISSCSQYPWQSQDGFQQIPVIRIDDNHEISYVRCARETWTPTSRSCGLPEDMKQARLLARMRCLSACRRSKDPFINEYQMESHSGTSLAAQMPLLCPIIFSKVAIRSRRECEAAGCQLEDNLGRLHQLHLILSEWRSVTPPHTTPHPSQDNSRSSRGLLLGIAVVPVWET